MLEAKPSDFSSMPRGICDCQLYIGVPKMRNPTPRERKCAANERPYGPAPTIAIGVGTNPSPLYVGEQDISAY